MGKTYYQPLPFQKLLDAIVIAGGFGTRLRPLTYHRPKPLMPLANRALILHVLDRLPPEVDNVVIASNYMVDEMRYFFRHAQVPRNVTIIEERSPLGTGGAIKNAQAHLSSPFFVVNGDVISSLNFDSLRRFHSSRGGIGAIALWEVDDPSPYGAVALQGDRITRFVEKPKKGKEPSKLINAGQYVFEREILKGVALGTEVSLEREIFPRVLDKGLFGFRFQGHWVDAGTRANFLIANRLILERGEGAIDPEATIASSTFLKRPVAIGSGCVLEGDVGPDVSVGANCRIQGATISNSVLLDNVHVGMGARVQDSIVGEGCTIGSGAVVSKCMIEDGVSVKPADTLVEVEVRR